MPTAVFAQGLGKTLISVLRGETEAGLRATPAATRTSHPSLPCRCSLPLSPRLWFGGATVLAVKQQTAAVPNAWE